MAKAFTDKEFDYFSSKLLEVGSKLFSSKGLSGVSVDLLVKEVGISKGSFYKFYTNKENLYFDVLMKLEKDIRVEIQETYSKYSGEPGILISKMLIDTPIILDKYPLIKVFEKPQELELLMLKVDPKKIEENYSGDSMFLGSMLNGSNLDESQKDSLTGLFWVIVFMSFNKDFFNGKFNQIIELIADMSKLYYENINGVNK